MKNIKKFVILLILVLIPLTTIEAETKTTPEEAIEDFIVSLTSRSDSIYNQIDNTNTELVNDIKGYTGNLKIDYNIIKVDNQNELTNAEIRINASGRQGNSNWEVNGIKVNITLKQENGNYIIIDTDIFDKIGTKNVFKFIFKIFAIVGAIFIIIAIIITTIVIVCIKNSKKKKGAKEV